MDYLTMLTMDYHKAIIKKIFKREKIIIDKERIQFIPTFENENIDQTVTKRTIPFHSTSPNDSKEN